MGQRVNEVGGSEGRPVTGRIGPPARRYPTRKGADFRLVLAVRDLSKAFTLGDVRRGSSSNRPRDRRNPRGPTSIGTRWRRMSSACKSGSTEPPRTRIGRGSRTLRSSSSGPHPTSSWPSGGSRRRTRGGTQRESTGCYVTPPKPDWNCSISGLALRVQGLSRMRDNPHVRFLGGWGQVTDPGYPRAGRAGHRAKGDRLGDI